jgi:hypothetical protein
MNSGQMIFAQLMDHLPRYEFQKCVARYRGDYKVKSFSCWDQFLCLGFAQLTYRESLRDIETCLRAAGTKLYHLGIRGKVSRNTMANASSVRDWRIYADFGQHLISIARPLYANDDFGLQLDSTVYALDSTTIDLCLSLFPWAHFRRRKAGVKLHTLLDLHGNIPAEIIITAANVHDINILDRIIIEAGAFYIMDRAYLDFGRLYRIHLASAFFVTRAWKNFSFRRIYSAAVDKSAGLLFDQTIRPAGFYQQKAYSEKLRRIGFYDAVNHNRLVFITNNFNLPAITIAELYQSRWQVELFFRWIKQHLRIKAFFGTSENAVKTQIWVAISVYVLVAIVKKRLNINVSMYRILQTLSLSLFEKTEILCALQGTEHTIKEPATCNQLNLFD